MRATSIKAGKIKLVDKEDFSKPLPRGGRPIEKEIWKGAVRSAKEVERRYGKRNLGPYSDFEWGMLAGKHSAIRWVLGYEWDVLDTLMPNDAFLWSGPPCVGLFAKSML